MAEEIVQTPFGSFQIDTADIIGSTTKAGTLWDGPGFLQPIAKEFGMLGTEGVTILDVGANIGTFSVWLAKHGAWRVIAVEPVPETMRYLKANLDLNKTFCADSVIPLEIAALNATVRMRADPIDPGNLGGTALSIDPTGPIQADRLDNWHHCFGNRVSLIKIDAQGCDGLAMLGLVDTIRCDAPAIVFEWEAGLAARHPPFDLPTILSWLDGIGYDVNPWPCYANNFLATART